MNTFLFSLKKDIIRHNGSLTLKGIISLYFNVPFRLVFNYRVGSFFENRKRSYLTNLIILWLKKNQISKYNCDISYRSKIGFGIFFPHPIGVVIGEGVVIGNNVMIWQQVTLGSHGKSINQKAYPNIADSVKIYSQSCVLGSIKVGQSAIIGAKSLVLKDVPEYSISFGIPAKNKIKI